MANPTSPLPCASTFHLPSTSLTPIPAPREADHILKIGVLFDQDIPFYDDSVSVVGKTPQHIRLDQTKTLEIAVNQLCEAWGLENPTFFALQFTQGRTGFVTEKNRNEIVNGWVLALAAAPARASEVLIVKLKSSAAPETIVEILNKVAKLALDIAFAQAFVEQKGLHYLVKMVQESKCSGPLLTLLLHCFCELMEHNLTSWDELDESFVSRVSFYVTGQAKHEDHKTLTAALNILELLVTNSSRQYPVVSREVKFESLIRHLDKSDQSVQHNTLALMNALFLKADENTKQDISELICGRPLRNALESNVLKRGVSQGTDLAHQLGVMQRLLFNFLNIRATTPFSKGSTADLDKLQELRTTAFETSGEAMSPSTARKHGGNTAKEAEFKKLGFETPSNPTNDLEMAPPGILALDCMLYYAKHYTEAFTRIILENSCRNDGHECPYAEMCIELARLLAEILKIADPPSDQDQTYSEMFFKHESPFQEFFSICLNLLKKTWREMNAAIVDKDKVLSVVREQVARSLEGPFPATATFGKFQDELGKFSYSEIQRIRQHESALREKSEFQTKPILELREELKPEILELIKQNRLNILEKGQIFPKLTKGTHTKKEKGKYWFWKLSANYKSLMYKDCEEKSPPNHDEMDDRLAVSDIRELIVGPRSTGQQTKDTWRGGKQPAPGLLFALRVDNPDERVNFVAPEIDTFNAWTDGLHTLLGEEMSSKQKEQDLETLLDLSVKIRLLDLEGIQIPNSPPPIPPPPVDFDFAYD